MDRFKLGVSRPPGDSVPARLARLAILLISLPIRTHDAFTSRKFRRPELPPSTSEKFASHNSFAPPGSPASGNAARPAQTAPPNGSQKTQRLSDKTGFISAVCSNCESRSFFTCRQQPRHRQRTTRPQFPTSAIPPSNHPLPTRVRARRIRPADRSSFAFFPHRFPPSLRAVQDFNLFRAGF